MAGHVVLAFHFGLVIKNIEVLENGDAGAELPAAEHLPQLDRVTVRMGGQQPRPISKRPRPTTL
jgi:hypothetical protein